MQTKSIVIQPFSSLPPSQRRIENLDMAFLSVISIVMLSTIGILIYACIPKGRQRFSSFKPLPKTLCHRCQYFSDNHFLKCALHPEIVMTEQAVDCRDYCPHGEVKKVE